jgi:ankyrin repeat protein
VEIHSYASHGDCNGVRGELSKGVPVDVRDEQDYTPLAYAVSGAKPDEDMLQLLIASGADVNATDCETEYGESPLNVASRLGEFDAVRLLLDAGGDPSPLQWTELMKAVALGTCDDVQRYLDGGGSLDDRDRWDRTPWLLTSFVEDVEKARTLHSAGADVNDRGRGGDTALMHCAARGNADMLHGLVEIGTDIEAVDDAGNTALMLAAQAGETTCVHLLLKAGADPSRKNEYDENAMGMSSGEGRIVVPLRGRPAQGPLTRAVSRESFRSSMTR